MHDLTAEAAARVTTGLRTAFDRLSAIPPHFGDQEMFVWVSGTRAGRSDDMTVSVDVDYGALAVTGEFGAVAERLHTAVASHLSRGRSTSAARAQLGEPLSAAFSMISDLPITFDESGAHVTVAAGQIVHAPIDWDELNENRGYRGSALHILDVVRGFDRR